MKIPPVDIWIAGYKFCAQKVVPGIKVARSSTRRTSSPRTSARPSPRTRSRRALTWSSRSRAAAVSATLKAADDAGKWGIGVDVDQYGLAKRVLTSGVKRVDNGVFAVAKQAQQGKFKGGTDLVFDLKNGGMGIGKINPSVPASYIKLMNSYRAKIIAGKLKVPAAIK